MSYEYPDVEKNPAEAVGGSPYEEYDSGNGKRHPSYVLEDGAVPGESFEVGDSMHAKLMRFAGRFGVELRGIERVPEDERTDSGFRALLNVSTMVCRPPIADESTQWLTCMHSGSRQTWLFPPSLLAYWRNHYFTWALRMPC